MASVKRRDALSGPPPQEGSGALRDPIGADPRIAALAAAVVLVVALVAFRPLWTALHHEWSGHGLYGHGHLLLAMSVWLGWRAWRTAPPRRVAPDWWFALPVAGLVGLMIVLDLMQIGRAHV